MMDWLVRTWMRLWALNPGHWREQPPHFTVYFPVPDYLEPSAPEHQPHPEDQARADLTGLGYLDGVTYHKAAHAITGRFVPTTPAGRVLLRALFLRQAQITYDWPDHQDTWDESLPLDRPEWRRAGQVGNFSITWRAKAPLFPEYLALAQEDA